MTSPVPRRIIERKLKVENLLRCEGEIIPGRSGLAIKVRIIGQGRPQTERRRTPLGKAITLSRFQLVGDRGLHDKFY